jgi:hypothetical protein
MLRYISYFCLFLLSILAVGCSEPRETSPSKPFWIIAPETISCAVNDTVICPFKYGFIDSTYFNIKCVFNDSFSVLLSDSVICQFNTDPSDTFDATAIVWVRTAGNFSLLITLNMCSSCEADTCRELYGKIITIIAGDRK